MELSRDDLINITGGGKINYGLLSAISAGIMFLIGLVDGYLRPLSCNK